MPKYQIFVDDEDGNEAEDSTSFVTNKEFESGFGSGSGSNVDDISSLWDQAVQDVSGGSSGGFGGSGGLGTGNSPHSSQGSSSREGISQSGTNTQHSNSSASELRFGSLTSPSNTSKKPQRSSFTEGGNGGKSGNSGVEGSKVVSFVLNSRVYIFVNENQYMFAIWCMILIQICLLVFMCQHLSFINAVQSKFFPDGTFKSPDSVEVRRNLDLEESVRVSRGTFYSVVDMCHTFMCFETSNSDFSSECLCFTEIERQWDTAKGLCEEKLSGVDGKLAVFDTESKQQSLESILKEYFAHRPTDDSYSYYSGPQFWVSAKSVSSNVWKWTGSKEEQRLEYLVSEADSPGADCLALRGDGYLEPKPCWPRYSDTQLGVICEKKIANLKQFPGQSIKHNQTCDFYGSIPGAIGDACKALKAANHNVTDQVFCNSTTNTCYVFLKPHQLEGDNNDYYRHYYGSIDWLDNRWKCKEDLKMDDYVSFNDIYEQQFIIDSVTQHLNHLDYLQVGATKFGTGDMKTWKWVDVESESTLDQSDINWAPGMSVNKGGSVSHCLAAELNKQKMDEYIDESFFSGVVGYDVMSASASPMYQSNRPWFHFVDFNCMEMHHFICEFSPSEGKDLKTTDDVQTESYPLSFAHLILEKNHIFFDMIKPYSKTLFFVPKEKANLYDADDACQHAIKSQNFIYSHSEAQHAAIHSEDEKQFLMEKVAELKELLPDDMAAVAARFNWDTNKFEWKHSTSADFLDISNIPMLPPGGNRYRPHYNRYRDYGSDEDQNLFPLLSLSASEGNSDFTLKSYYPARYDYFYRNAYKAPILCRAELL